MQLKILVFILLFFFNDINCNVIGFDFGSNFFKITLVKPGQPFSIVENTSSQRKTHNMLSFTEDIRLFGPDSYMELTKYPQSTFEKMQRWLGMKYDKEKLDKLKEEYYIYNEMVEDERGQIGWIVKKKDTLDMLYTEEIIAMLLKFGK